MWDGSEGQVRFCNDNLDSNHLPAEFQRVMSMDVMDTLDWIRRMPMLRRMDAILKRERALELSSGRAEQGDSGESSGCGVTLLLIWDCLHKREDIPYACG